MNRLNSFGKIHGKCVGRVKWSFSCEILLQIRLTEGQQQKTGNDLKPEQQEKVAKLEDWRKELKLLEDKKASLEAL